MNFRGCFFMGFLVLLLSAMVTFGQTDVVVDDNTRTVEPLAESLSQDRSANQDIIKMYDQQILQIREDTQRRIEELQSEQRYVSENDQVDYKQTIAEVKLEAEASILEIRSQQELARGNEEQAQKFVQAAEMMRNPAPRQAPDPAVDQTRFENQRSSNPSSR